MLHKISGNSYLCQEACAVYKLHKAVKLYGGDVHAHIIIIGGHAKLVIGLLVVVHGNGFSGS